MLNQHDDGEDGRTIKPTGMWCVGEAPLRWDVGLGARIAETIRGLFWHDRGERAVTLEPMPPVAEGPRDGRRAA
jgi:hypothetical protein